MDTEKSMTEDLSEKHQMRVAGSDDNIEPEVEIADESREKLVYNVSDRPPIHLTIFFAFQQALLSLAANLTVSLFVADVACASDFADIKTELLSSTLFMSGVTTLLMSVCGIGLPVFQGAAGDFIVPLLAMQMIDKTMCDVKDTGAFAMNKTENAFGTTTVTILNATAAENPLMDMKRMLALRNLREGCLIMAGIIQFLIGFTGCAGYLLRFIGPVTVVPTILLSGIYSSKAIQKFCKAHWGVTFLTALSSLFLSLYIGHKKMPIPLWSRKKGFYILWYPFHEVFSILIGMMLGWFVSYILTVTGTLTDDPSKAEFFARTDARAGVIERAQWFRVPYPRNPDIDHILKTLLSNANLCGGIVAFVLDNTVPGTKEERGIATWQSTLENEEEISDSLRKYNEGPQLYEPIIPRKWLSAKIFKYLPIFPYKPRNRLINTSKL